MNGSDRRSRAGETSWRGHDHGPQRRPGQNEGSRGSNGEGDPPLAAGSLAFDGHDLAQTILGVNDPRSGPEAVDVDVRGGIPRGDSARGGGQVGGGHQPEITRRRGRSRFVTVRLPPAGADRFRITRTAHAREVADHDRPLGQLVEKPRGKRGLLLAPKRSHHAPARDKARDEPG